MARPQKHGKKGNSKNGSKKSKGSAGSKNLAFQDAVLDASKFLNKNGQYNGAGEDDEDENDNLEFNDEELDSDDALGSDDDLDHYMANKNKNTEKVYNEYGEEEDGWESVDEGELMTLSELWDRDDKELKQLDSNKSKKSGSSSNAGDKDKEVVFNDDEESESDDDSDSEEESSSEEEESDDDPFDEMNISDDDVELGSVLKNLKTKLPKEEKAKKLLINDKTTENEFSLHNQGDSLTFDDMLEDMGLDNDDDDEEHDENNDALIRDIVKQSKKAKAAAAAAASTGSNESDDDEIVENDENSAFSIPLPVNIQKRHERRAAYEIQKEQVNRWRDIIAENRDKDVLKFIPEKVKIDNNSAFKTDNEISINDFESKLDSIIDQSNMESKKTEDLFENIETAKLSKAEMLKRTNELRLMRELMYRGMKDSKRLKKIKSRAYRKQLRKDKLKEEQLISQVNRQEGIESEDEDDDPLYQRAKERMTLKHKNTSQWAKRMIKSGMSKDKSTRDELEEMMRQSENLRMKQLGKEENKSSDDERDLSDLEEDVSNMKQLDDEKLSKVGKGVLAMDFMKNAAERERLLKLKEIEELKNFETQQGYEDLEDNEINGINVQVNTGRRMYTPSALAASEEARKLDEKLLEELDEEDSRLLKNRLAVKEKDNIRVVNDKKRQYKEDSDDENDDEPSNPWLNDGSGDESEEEERVRSSSKLKIVDERSSKSEKSAAKIAKKLSQRTEELKRESQGPKYSDANDFTIDNQNTLKIVDPKRKTQSKSKDSHSDDEYESDGDDADDIHMFKQSDLIKQAFAGDDVLVEEFQAEKKAIEEDEGDKEVDLTVPGWGSWAGAEDGQDDGWGVPRNNKKRKIVKTVEGVVSKDKRQDKGKAGVIINEKVNKRNNKYQADKVPYPYKTWDEYERSLRTPLGKEWTTTQTHQKMITPSVITRYGSVIDPLKAPFSEK